MADDWKRRLEGLHEDLVRRDDPTAWVTEADAVEASYRYPHIALRGPVFGLATRDEKGAGPWTLLQPVVCGTPQEARDGLNSFLWFKAKDETEERADRRELLAAVSLLEREPVNEVEALGTRYRVVRGEEFARSRDDRLEPPRPTDVEPSEISWERGLNPSPPDTGFALDTDRKSGLALGAMELGLQSFAYTGSRFPEQVRADSLRATETHPQVVLLPVSFGVVEHLDDGWRPRGSLMPTPHEARRLLYDCMTETWPLISEFDDETRAVYARAAEEFRAAGRADEVRVDNRLLRICRIERMVRCGSEGPEQPRSSDQDSYGPMKMHPTMDEDGTLHHDDD
ncbi:DUF5954 family protein [Streptomyces sp. NPDC050560]|uniref:DUF5954 family protein n=1 Tax=Streptomyces sp. NPDC050560 TaxID=3365630 RepID=UPI00378C1C42